MLNKKPSSLRKRSSMNRGSFTTAAY
jgi:hypothetical protein